MNVSHTNGVKAHIFIFAAAEFHSWTRWIQVPLLLHFWRLKHLCGLSKLHLLYLSDSRISGTRFRTQNISGSVGIHPSTRLVIMKVNTDDTLKKMRGMCD